MAVFNDSADLETIIGGFFERLRYVEEAHLIHQIGGSVEFIFHRPESRIRWVIQDPGVMPPFQVKIGELDVPPLLTFEQNGDTAHRFWLGTLDLQQALARQLVRARGPLSRAMKLIPHLDTIYPVYAEHLQAIGRQDLLAALS